MVKGVAGNIRKFYAYTFFQDLAFISPILAVFLLSKGLSYTQVLLLYGLVTLTPVLLEIPTGYVADVFGRKFSLIVAGSSFVFGVGMLLFADSFPAFVAAMMLVGFGTAFRSGADSAFVYDTLLSEKKEKEFPKIWGKIQFILFTTTAIAALLGGRLAERGFLVPILLSVVVLTISLLVIFSFKEPVREKPVTDKGHVHLLRKILKFSISHPQIRALIVYAVLFSPLVLLYQILVQPLTLSFGLSLTTLGILYAGLMVCTGLGPFLTEKFRDSLPIKWQFFAVSLAGGLAVMFMAIIKSPWILLLLIVPAIAYGMSRVLINTVINDLVSSDKRATVLSVQNMAFTAALSGITIVSGRIIDAYSFKPILFVIGLLPLLGAVMVLLLLRNTSYKK